MIFLLEAPDAMDEQTALTHNVCKGFFVFAFVFFFVLFCFANSGCIDSYCFAFICAQVILEFKMNTFKLGRQSFDIIVSHASQVHV